MRVLVVEDDELFGSAVQKWMVRDGHAVDWVLTGRDAAIAVRAQAHDCVLLDLGLPDISGESLVSLIRQRDAQVGVVVLTARAGVRDRVRLLDCGADDYMVKPVDLAELGARVRTVCRRARSASAGLVLEHGALKLHPERHSASWHGHPVALTRKEYSLMDAFVRKKAQVLTRAQLEEAMYGWEDDVGSNAVEVHIHNLRRKFSAKIIRTLRGLGYQLGAEDEVE